MKKLINDSRYEIVFDTALSIIGESTRTIQKKHFIKRISALFFDIQKNFDKILLELRFKRERITLLCIFEKNKICETVYIFLDDQRDLDVIAGYLGRRYPESICLDFWLSQNSALSIETNKFDSCIKVFSLSDSERSFQN